MDKHNLPPGTKVRINNRLSGFDSPYAIEWGKRIGEVITIKHKMYEHNYGMLYMVETQKNHYLGSDHFDLIETTPEETYLEILLDV